MAGIRGRATRRLKRFGVTSDRMPRTPETHAVLTPAAAAYVFGISDARLRRLALDGRLRTRTLTGTGWKPSRVYFLDDLRARWAEVPDRLDLLLKVSLLEIGRETGTLWEVYMPRPRVVDTEEA